VKKTSRFGPREPDEAAAEAKVGLNKEEEEGGRLHIRQGWAFLLKEPVIGSKSGFVKAVSLA
jgi:hypothetical protein